jgi:hypothetical protein
VDVVGRGLSGTTTSNIGVLLSSLARPVDEQVMALAMGPHSLKGIAVSSGSHFHGHTLHD